MKIDNLDNGLNLEKPGKKKISFHRKKGEVKPDSVELSNETKTLQVQKDKSPKITKIKDVAINYSTGAQKIEEIKRNLSSGLYKKQEYKEKNVDKLMHSQELKDMIYSLGWLKSVDSTRSEKIEKIKYKLAIDFYNKSEILEKIAERLIKEFGFE